MQLNILSLDLEDWYLSYDSSQIHPDKWASLESRVERNTTIFLDFLDQRKQKATFFILGYIAEKHPDLIKRISAAGHEIGYHSYFHALPVKQGAKTFEEDLVSGLGLLEDITEKKIQCYRAPMFSLCKDSAWTIPILLKHGITISSSYKAFTPFNHHSIPHLPFLFEHNGQFLIEFPLNRQKMMGLKIIYSGSGYFRLLPLWIIKYLFGHHSYNMTYFHPRDFDNNVPSTSLLPSYRNVMSRYGNAGTLTKLQSTLERFPFMSICEASERLDKNSLQIVKI